MWPARAARQVVVARQVTPARRAKAEQPAREQPAKAERPAKTEQPAKAELPARAARQVAVACLPPVVLPAGAAAGPQVPPREPRAKAVLESPTTQTPTKTAAAVALSPVARDLVCPGRRYSPLAQSSCFAVAAPGRRSATAARTLANPRRERAVARARTDVLATNVVGSSFFARSGVTHVCRVRRSWSHRHRWSPSGGEPFTADRGT